METLTAKESFLCKRSRASSSSLYFSLRGVRTFQLAQENRQTELRGREQGGRGRRLFDKSTPIFQPKRCPRRAAPRISRARPPLLYLWAKSPRREFLQLPSASVVSCCCENFPSSCDPCVTDKLQCSADRPAGLGLR